MVSSALAYFPDGSLQTGHPVVPDVTAEAEPRDYLGGSDAVLDRALGLLYSAASGGKRASIAPSLSSRSKPSLSVNTNE